MSIMVERERFSITMEKSLVDWLDADVKAGRYSSRARAIEARVRQVKELAGQEKKDVAAFFIECMELVAEHPEVIEEFRKFWKKE